MIVIKTKVYDYITCPYPITAFYQCRALILIKDANVPMRCPNCFRSV